MDDTQYLMPCAVFAALGALGCVAIGDASGGTATCCHFSAEQHAVGVDPRFGAYNESTAWCTTDTNIGRRLRCFYEAQENTRAGGGTAWGALQLIFREPVRTNSMSPLTLNAASMQLAVPQDNDLMSMYCVGFCPGATSSFVTSTKDIVLGFLSHSLWKTGFVTSLLHDKLQAIVGLNSALHTRDAEPHGYVDATESPMLAIIPISGGAALPSESDGLRLYARLCGRAESAPPPPPKHRGWNSWAITVNGGGPTLEMFLSASELFERSASIVRDAVYELNASSTAQWVRAATTAGQRAGTYAAPFALFSQSVTQNATVQCGGMSWPLLETVLTSASGEAVRAPSNPKNYVRDVTHPATRCIVVERIARAVANNMNAIKYDFLNYAAFEGQRYNMTLAPTGMAAYAFGISLLHDELPDDFRVDFGISPPLPVGQRPHARHVGCEQMYGAVRYTMNQLKGGFWLSEVVLPDPDLVTLVDANCAFRPQFKGFGLGSVGRVAKAIVFGGVWKSGDDLSNATTRAAVMPYLTNPKLTAMWNRSNAKHHFDFRANESSLDADVWRRHSEDAEDDVVVFNYSPILSYVFKGRGSAACVNVVTGHAVSLPLRIPKRRAVVLQCSGGALLPWLPW